MNEKHSIKFTFAMNLLCNIASYIFPLITYPYVTRMLEPSAIGQVTFAQSFSTYFSMLAAFGISSYATRQVAVLRDKKDQLQKFVKEILILEILLSSVVTVVYILSITYMPFLYSRRSLLLLMELNILTGGISCSWFYTGLEKFDNIARRYLISKTISVVLLFITVRNETDVFWYGVFVCLADTMANIWGLIELHRYISLCNASVSFENIRTHCRKSIIFFATTIANCIYTNLDAVMLTAISGDTQTGYYSSALKIRLLLVSIVLSLGRALFPRISYEQTKGDQTHVYDLIRVTLHLALIMACYFAVFVFLYPKTVLNIFAGRKFLDASVALKWTVLCVPVIAASNIFTEQLYIAENKEKLVSKIIFSGAIIDMILNAVLMPEHGASGGAAATFITELFVLGCCIFINFRDQINVFKLSENKPLLVTVVLLVLIFKFIFPNNLLSIPQFILIGVAYTAIYCGFLLAFKDELVIKIVKRILSRIRRNNT